MKPAPLKPSMILQVVARICFWPGLFFAAWLLWVGHNAPGGGFIAGLVALAILVLRMMAFGWAWKADQLDRAGPALLLAGLAAAASTGTGSLAVRFPFLTSAVSEQGYTTAFFFDLGVALVVIGAGLMILRLFGEPSHE